MIFGLFPSWLLQSAQKWKQLSELAIAKSQFGLAMDCLYSAKDYSGLMLLATSAGDASTIEKMAAVASAEGQNNLAFTSNFLLGRYGGLEDPVGIHTYL